MTRTHNNSELSLKDENKKVTLEGFVGKLRNTGKKAFLDLRDFYGITQIVINENLIEICSKIKTEWIIRVEGVVVKRISPNPHLKTGQIEVIADKIEIISSAILAPFEVKDEIDTHEDTRYKYRYIDIRREPVKNKIKLRSDLYHIIRDFMYKQQFVEIPTPILGRATPEGARDFIIPSRLNKSKYYALPQSPQLYKQLFMVSGIDKYYQIARSFRDEDLRNDRQLEFDQLDLEMAFSKQEDVIELIDKLIKYVIKEIANQDIKEIKKITFSDSLEKYGVDKPDIRFDLFIKTLNDLFVNNEFELFKDSSKSIRGIAIDKILSKKEIEDLNEIARQNNVSFFSFVKFENGQWSGSLNSKLSEEEKSNLLKTFDIKDAGTFIICCDRYDKVCAGLGQIRNYIGKVHSLYDKNILKPCFIVDFPLFEWSDEENRYVSAHNPFTMPNAKYLDNFESKKEEALAASYDLVINGYEIGSGAERITNPDIQKRMFNAIEMKADEIENSFGWFINGYKYGSPYHAGMGLGLDRLVMIFTNSDSIREVVAFPKNSNGICYLTEAPGLVDEEILKNFK